MRWIGTLGLHCHINFVLGMTLKRFEIQLKFAH